MQLVPNYNRDAINLNMKAISFLLTLELVNVSLRNTITVERRDRIDSIYCNLFKNSMLCSVLQSPPNSF